MSNIFYLILNVSRNTEEGDQNVEIDHQTMTRQGRNENQKDIYTEEW